jgi:hypothetical protein
MVRFIVLVVAAFMPWPGLATLAAQEKSLERVLFDFETAADVAAWANLELPGAKEKEPPVKIERSAEHATSGRSSLKLTFAGGHWPTVTTTQVLDDWLPYQTFLADVTVSRPCLVGFTAMQEKSLRGGGWDAGISRWTKTAFLQKGRNQIVASIVMPNDYAIAAKWGKVVRFEIFLYEPHVGESIHVDHIRLSPVKQKAPVVKRDFAVAGTDWVFSGPSSASAVIEMGKKLKPSWTKPEAKTLAQHEAAMQARLVELRKTHPRAMLAVLREGDKGFDPANPDRIYTGWADAHVNSHGPDGLNLERADNRGGAASHEVFMRHRSAMMRVDLSSIPADAEILAAQLIVVRANDKYLDDHNPEKKATLWVVEPCLRPWVEHEVNAYRYSKDRFWKEIGGMQWDGDADFAPVFLAHGPGQGKVNAWDFTHAVRYWTTERRPNHGFMLHGDSHDYLTAATREAKNLRDRPALLVIYQKAKSS